MLLSTHLLVQRLTNLSYFSRFVLHQIHIIMCQSTGLLINSPLCLKLELLLKLVTISAVSHSPRAQRDLNAALGVRSNLLK